MAARGSAQPGGGFINGQVLLLATAFVLPGIAPAYFGWLSGLLAIPVFCLLGVHGVRRGGILIRNALLLAAVAALLFKLIGTLLFALTIIPLGYSFHRSAAAGDSEWNTVGKGCLLLGACWLLFWTVYGAVEGVQPYQQLLQMIDDGFAQSYEYYRAQAGQKAETLLYLEQAVAETRRLVPHLLPGLLGCIVIFTVWVNLMGGISLLGRLKPGQLPWKKFSGWRLPDWLVWPTIGAMLLLLAGGDEIATVAFSLVLTCGLLYFFQGLGVFMHLLDRWKVPLALRVLFYGMLILQSYGLLLLSLLGLADVWVDFRRRAAPRPEAGN
ncbi:MAG TPA: hypothetical protein DDY20_01815 [Desulfobulbaceae bacterium]|nr:hypothetical protein [Desulfobulbaceae bacterium]